jgi:hypothetical protein
MAAVANDGLKKWAASRKTSTIKDHLEGHDVDDAGALAVWIRKQAIGLDQFKKNQDEARAKKKR